MWLTGSRSLEVLQIHKVSPGDRIYVEYILLV